MKLHDSGAVVHVGRNRGVRLGAQHVVGEAGQVALWADFQEQAHAIAVHTFDRFAETHGA